MASPVQADLIEKLLGVRQALAQAEETTAILKDRLNAAVVKLRKTEPQLSLRTVADLAGISHAQVRNLEQADG